MFHKSEGNAVSLVIQLVDPTQQGVGEGEMTMTKALSCGLVLACSVSAGAPTWAICDASQPSRTPISRYRVRTK
jgi:hypothetical protein